MGKRQQCGASLILKSLWLRNQDVLSAENKAPHLDTGKVLFPQLTTCQTFDASDNFLRYGFYFFISKGFF